MSLTIEDTLTLELNELSKQFGSNSVLNGVTLSLEPGTTLGLLGKNGSGKTTLLKCALGLLRPTDGKASLFGEEAWNLSAEAKGQLGYVSQEVSTYPWMRVDQVLDYTAAFYTNWNHELCEELCRRWDLPLKDRAGTLSTGQLQSLGIVLALSHEPRLLVLDEPVASLDPEARRQFIRTLIEIIDTTSEAASDRTIIFSTHITSDLERIANRIAVLQGGMLTFDNDLDAFKEQIKRLRITRREGVFPSSFEVRDSLNCQVEGSTANVTVKNYNEALRQELESTWDADVSVTDLNLEEIFLELHYEKS